MSLSKIDKTISPEKLDETIGSPKIYSTGDLRDFLDSLNIKPPYELEVDIKRVPPNFWDKSEFRAVRYSDKKSGVRSPEVFFKIYPEAENANGCGLGPYAGHSLDAQFQYLLHLYTAMLPVPRPLCNTQIAIDKRNVPILISEYWAGPSFDSYLIAIDKRLKFLKDSFKSSAEIGFRMSEKQEGNYKKEFNILTDLRKTLLQYPLDTIQDVAILSAYWRENPSGDEKHRIQLPAKEIDYTSVDYLKKRLQGHLIDSLLYLLYDSHKINEDRAINARKSKKFPKFVEQGISKFNALEGIVDLLISPLSSLGEGLPCLGDTSPHNYKLHEFEKEIKAGFFDAGSIGKGRLELDVARFLISPIVNVSYDSAIDLYNYSTKKFSEFMKKYKGELMEKGFADVASLKEFRYLNNADFGLVMIYQLIKSLSYIASDRLGNESALNNLCDRNYSCDVSLLRKIMEGKKIEVPDYFKQDQAITQDDYRPNRTFPLLQSKLNEIILKMLDGKGKEFQNVKPALEKLRSYLKDKRIIHNPSEESSESIIFEDNK